MSKLYFIIVLIIYIVMAYMWIMVIVRKDYRFLYIPKAIGVSVGFAMNMIGAVINSGVLGGTIYGIAILLLMLLCVFISIHSKNKAKKEKRAIQKKIISSPIYKAIIDEFNQNNYGALYICSDGVCFCRYLAGLSFPEETYTSYADSVIEADRIAKQRAEEWKQKMASTTGIMLIPAPVRRFPYSIFGYEDMGEKELSAFTELIAEKLNLDYHYITKSFKGDAGSISFAPTGAVTVNGRTTFTGSETKDYWSGYYSLRVIGAVHRKEAIISKQELKHW